MYSDEALAYAIVIGLEGESIDRGQHMNVRPRKLLLSWFSKCTVVGWYENEAEERAKTAR